MMEFLKKATDWILEKEDEAANNCKIDLDDVQKQIDMISRKKDSIQKEYADNVAELEHILQRLQKIKSDASSCDTNI